MGLGDYLSGFALGGPLGSVANGLSGGAVTNAISGAMNSPDAEFEAQRKRQLQGQAGQAGDFANQAQGNYNNMTQQGMQSINDLRDLANGKNSVSAEQLRQGLQQNLATQRSMAAGANPQNAAMAARNAAMNMNRSAYGMTGQQAVAGLQERNQATQNLAQLLGTMRGQDVNAALGSRGNAINGYGANAFGQQAPSLVQQYGPAVQSGLQMAAMSDRRLKRDIEDGGKDADRAMEGLKAYRFRYRDEKHGKGSRVGIMAQDAERAGLGHAVIETPEGKALHAGHLSASNAAMISRLAERLGKLEGKAK